jgi:uncharacterized protein YdbL (DUF1318 family)
MALLDFEQPPRDIPKEIAATLLQAMNAEADRRAGIQRDSYNAFWHSTEATPQQIADAMGNRAGLFFALASENVTHIARAAAVVGKELGEFLQTSEYVPPVAITYHEDGTVTIGE